MTWCSLKVKHLRKLVVLSVLVGMMWGMQARGGVIVLPSQNAGGAGGNLRVTNEVKVYQAVKDAVVNIASTRLINAPVGTGDEVFDSYFGPRFIRQVPTLSLGSGFVIHESGYIITNEHVIDRANAVQVIMADGRKLDAKVLATDEEHDLAVLKVVLPVGQTLPAITLGASEDLLIGEPVYAIGNPYGYSGSMTRGIVSAVDRTLDFGPGKTYKGLVQTDASINPGNSGGPLLNAYGQVIGINTAIRGDAHGIGFAISASALRDLLPALLNAQAIHRGVVGFHVEEKRVLVPPATVQGRILIKSIMAQSEAAKAGLLPGDEILQVQGKPVEGNLVELLVRLAELHVGDTLTLRVARSGAVVGGAGKYFDVKIPVIRATVTEVERIVATHMGITGQDVTEALATKEKLSVSSGILVTQVEKGGPAAEAGLQKGDVVYQIGPYYVGAIDSLAALLKTAKPGLQVRIGVVRGESRGRTLLTIR